MKDFLERASVVADELLSELEPKLQRAVLDADWDYPIDLENSNGNLVLTYDEDNITGLFEAEYGRLGGAPAAVIRPFLRESEPVIRSYVEDSVISYLFDKGILP